LKLLTAICFALVLMPFIAAEPLPERHAVVGQAGCVVLLHGLARTYPLMTDSDDVIEQVIHLYRMVRLSIIQAQRLANSRRILLPAVVNARLHEFK
jgi:hypothetical protein